VSPEPTTAADRFRARQLAAIHVAKKRLRLDDETYRALLERIGGQRSAKDLDPHGRRAVLREFARLDKGREAKTANMLPGTPQNVREEIAALVGKIGAILEEAGRSWNYAHGMAKRMFHVQRAQWLHADQLHKLVAALMIDQKRRRKKPKV
jgi:phage gp16-like protein